MNTTALIGWNGIKVRPIYPDGVISAAFWRVDAFDGPEAHTSTETLLKALGAPPTWSFDRCFNLGPFLPTPIFPEPDGFNPGNIVVDPGVELAPNIPLLLEPSLSIAEVSLENFSTLPETFWPLKSFPEKLSGINKGKLGIDLNLRGHEVKKLLFKGFGSWIFSCGYDPDEVFQEVCRGILVRNKGRGAFDVRRSSFGHYVHNVCRCILSNWHRRETRRRSCEQIGIMTVNNGKMVEVDVAETDRVPFVGSRYESHEEGLVQMDLATFMAQRGLARTETGKLAMEIIPFVAEGLNRTEIANILEPKGGKAAVIRAFAILKRQALAWSKLS